MNQQDEPLCRSDAAYVVGALSPVERRAYEAHLTTCEDCQKAVRDLAGVPGLLARVSPADFDDPPPVPATLLPALLSAVRRGRVRRRVAMGLLGAAAAVVVALLALQVQPGAGNPDPIAMRPVVASPVRATVTLVDKAWGTSIELRCSYGEATDGPSTPNYRLVATGDDGSTRQVATWQIVPGKVSTITGAVDLKSTDIASLSLETDRGTSLLVARP